MDAQTVIPLNDIQDLKDKHVNVLLYDLTEIMGIMSGYDKHMNVFLDDAKEMKGDKIERQIGKTLISNIKIVSISLE